MTEKPTEVISFTEGGGQETKGEENQIGYKIGSSLVTMKRHALKVAGKEAASS